MGSEDVRDMLVEVVVRTREPGARTSVHVLQRQSFVHGWHKQFEHLEVRHMLKLKACGCLLRLPESWMSSRTTMSSVLGIQL